MEKIWKRDPPLWKVQSWVSTLLSHSHITQALMSDKTLPLFLAWAPGHLLLCTSLFYSLDVVVHFFSYKYWTFVFSTCITRCQKRVKKVRNNVSMNLQIIILLFILKTHYSETTVKTIGKVHSLSTLLGTPVHWCSHLYIMDIMAASQLPSSAMPNIMQKRSRDFVFNPWL